MQNQSILEPAMVFPSSLVSDPGISTNEGKELNNVDNVDDDAYLINACLAGKESAWEELLERYGRLIYTIPLRFDFPRNMADEIYQEVCLILLKKLHTLQDKARLQSWLVTITKRLCLQYRAQHFSVTSLDTQLDLLIADDNCEEKILLDGEYQVVREAVAALDPRCQQLLKALFFEDPPRSYAEIAQALGLPLGSVGPTRARCLTRLSEEIAKLEAVGPIANGWDT